jgi:hypothetical protein
MLPVPKFILCLKRNSKTGKNLYLLLKNRISLFIPVYIYRIKILGDKIKLDIFIEYILYQKKKMMNFLTSIKKQGIYSFLEMWNQ